MKVEHISASRIKTYRQCPLKYWAVYDQGMSEPPPHPKTLMGSAAHEILEMAVKSRIDPSCDPAKHDPRFWRSAAIQNHKVERNLWNTLDELIANAERWGYFRNIHRTCGCEVEVGFMLPNGINAKGFIDRLDLMPPDVDIIDIKTQSAAFEQDELEDNWQAHLYNIGARRIRPEITGKATVSFWVLRHQVQRVVLTARDAENDIGRLVGVVDEIRKCEEPEGRPSGLCPWCPYEKRCPDRNSSAKERFGKAKRRWSR
jgi:RecB family exonuclease